MTKQNITAVKASIKHWERMRDNKPQNGEMPTDEYCPLCLLYFDEECEGCPIMSKTDDGRCRGTPYRDAYDAWQDNDGTFSSPAFKTAAQKEIDFLKSLLPKKVK